MEILIKKNAYVLAGTSSSFRSILKSLEGKWIKVETNHLFHNQYNTVPVEGSETGLRIYDSMVEAIRGDVRHLHKKCKYCGSMTGIISPDCAKYPECKTYGMERFTPENTYFLKYPAGICMHKHERELSIHPDCPKFGTYYLETFPELDYYRIYNCRKTINFKFDGKLFYVHDGIGYKAKERLDIPYGEFKALLNHLKRKMEVTK